MTAQRMVRRRRDRLPGRVGVSSDPRGYMGNMARICCPKGHYHDVADEPGTMRTINGITVEARSAADLIQLCPADGCGWFQLRDGLPSWPEHPMGGTHDNVTHLVASGVRQILHREYPRESDREIAVQDNLIALVRGWEPELRRRFPRVDWNQLDLDDVIAEVDDDEGLHSAT
jgi:hypothetical protein